MPNAPDNATEPLPSPSIHAPNKNTEFKNMGDGNPQIHLPCTCTNQSLGERLMSPLAVSPASTVRSALRVLVDKELVAEDEDGYSVYDRFFGLWLRR